MPAAIIVLVLIAVGCGVVIVDGCDDSGELMSLCRKELYPDPTTL
jgi:hypoxanthine phosphoribosyltransferase